MDNAMRIFFRLFLISTFFWACTAKDEKPSNLIMTVTGPIAANQMGKTLEHEHVLVDFTGAEKVVQPQYAQKQALDSLLLYFVQLKKKGVQTLIECTPNYIGRDVLLLKSISEQTGLNILTNTGYYAAAEKKYLPAHTYIESAHQLAKRWINEWDNGINGTGIKPGFIKLGVGKNNLDSIEQKIVLAGTLTHLTTGLKMAIHTGSADAANDEIDILKEQGVDPVALIVVHSQNMSSEDQIKIIKRGAWVSLDGINDGPESINKYTDYLEVLKKENLLHKTLISQDAYWLVISKENGEIGFEHFGSPYSAIFDILIPKLTEMGFTQEDIDQLLIKNPAEAYKIGICKIN